MDGIGICITLYETHLICACTVMTLLLHDRKVANPMKGGNKFVEGGSIPATLQWIVGS